MAKNKKSTPTCDVHLEDVEISIVEPPKLYTYYIIESYYRKGTSGTLSPAAIRECGIITVEYNLDTPNGLSEHLELSKTERVVGYVLESWKLLSSLPVVGDDGIDSMADKLV